MNDTAPTLEELGWTADHLVACSAMRRVARKFWECRCSDPEGANFNPDCTRHLIAPGEVCVEYQGETFAFHSGPRYHVACWHARWGPPSRHRGDLLYWVTPTGTGEGAVPA